MLAFCAPAAIRLLMALGFLSNTVRGKAFSTLPAIGLPMLPTPMKPTDVAMYGLLGGDHTAGDAIALCPRGGHIDRLHAASRGLAAVFLRDRKSTRLNSSHVKI